MNYQHKFVADNLVYLRVKVTLADHTAISGHVVKVIDHRFIILEYKKWIFFKRKTLIDINRIEDVCTML
jgi:hypothetical protein